jgi:hypothetical protein
VHWGLPHELVVRDDLVEARGLHPQGQALAVAAVDLVLQQQLEKLDRTVPFGLLATATSV